MVGGPCERNPSDPLYRALARESLQKYLEGTGDTLDGKEIEVTNVTTQIVSGTMTRIDFKVRPVNGDPFACHAEIWEQVWMNKKEINVTRI